MTVSRVVNGDARVREATRAKVEAIIQQTGYVPDPAARILARAGAGRIGLLYANPSNAYLAEVLSGALEGARSVGLLLLIEPSRPGVPAEEREAVRRLAAGGAQGVIVPPPLGESDATLEAVAKSRMKAVVLAAPARPDLLSLRVDDIGAAAQMARHLLDLGHRAIGFIEGRADQTASRDRLRGAQGAVDAVDGALMHVEPGDFTYRSGFEASRRLLSRPQPPTAIFASNDDMACGALAAVHAMGLSTPGDVSVVGFDDTYMAASVWPALTTVRQPVASMARLAASLLVREGEDPGPVAHELILRESTAPPRG